MDTPPRVRGLLSGRIRMWVQVDDLSPIGPLEVRAVIPKMVGKWRHPALFLDEICGAAFQVWQTLVGFRMFLGIFHRWMRF